MAITVTGAAHTGATSGGGTSTSLVDPATGTVQPVGQTGWTLAMSEEFGGTMTVTDSTLGYVKFRSDGPTWATWYPDWPMFDSQSPGGNHTNTNYAAYYATSKVSLDGAGTLRLACDKQVTATGLPYTAGMIQTLPSYTPTYGYFEARIKVDTAGVTGHWPAWWASASAFNTWPPEIDIWEYFGNGTQYNNNTFMVGQSTFTTTATATQDAYHVYGCKWTASTVVFYLDGTVTNTVTNVAQVPQTAQYLLLNNGARDVANPTFTSNGISVDYVRAWQ